MQFRGFLAVVVLVFTCVSVLAEPKAYEVVRYKGTAEGVTIALDFGDGYVDASHMWVTDRKSGKTTRFMLDESGEMRFVPKKPSAQKKEVVLKMGRDDGPAEKIEGTYTSTANRCNSRFGESSKRIQVGSTLIRPQPFRTARAAAAPPSALPTPETRVSHRASAAF